MVSCLLAFPDEHCSTVGCTHFSHVEAGKFDPTHIRVRRRLRHRDVDRDDHHDKEENCDPQCALDVLHHAVPAEAAGVLCIIVLVVVDVVVVALGAHGCDDVGGGC